MINRALAPWLEEILVYFDMHRGLIDARWELAGRQLLRPFCAGGTTIEQ